VLTLQHFRKIVPMKKLCKGVTYPPLDSGSSQSFRICSHHLQLPK